MKRASIRDVAVLAGTSPATVSKALNRMPDSGIPEETAERVRAAARELRYIPWLPAQALRRQRTETIGIVIPHLMLFFAEIVKGVQAAALAHELTTVLGVHGDDNVLEARHLRMGLRGQVDGLVIVPARANRNQRLYDELKERGVPFVFVDRYIPGYEADYVGLRNEEAAYRLTRTLIAQGAEVIGYASGSGGSIALAERHAGYRRALADAGLPQDEDLVQPDPGEPQPGRVERLLARRPRVEGLFWASYENAQPALSVLAAAGIRVPEDLRFAGFDKIVLALSRREDYQALQVIRSPWPAAIQPGYEMGQRALEILAQALAGGDSSAPQYILLEPHYEWLADTV